MSLRDWITKLRHREDAAALRDAEEQRTETAAERAAESGDIEGRAADIAAEEHGGEPPVER
jgi:hypothetical protein